MLSFNQSEIQNKQLMNNCIKAETKRENKAHREFYRTSPSFRRSSCLPHADTTGFPPSCL